MGRVSNWKFKKLENIFLYIILLRFWAGIRPSITLICSCFCVHVFVVNYFRDFPQFFLDRGVGGWGVSYPNFFGFFTYLQDP